MKPHFWPAVALLATVALAVFPLFQGKFFAIGDTRDVFIPLETFFRNEMVAGRLPAWNPDASWGFPVIASAQIGFFYPPLLLTRFLPIWLYLPLNVLAHLVATALGTYFFLKNLGRSDSAAYLGAIAFTLSAFIFNHLSHLNIIFAIAWFPWQLLLVQKFSPPYEGGVAVGGRRGVFLLACLIAIPFLAGQIQIPLLMALVTSAYFIFSSPRWKALIQLVLLASLAAGLASAQLFPTAELAWHSTRGQNSDFDIERANQYSWPLYHAPALLFPRFFGNDSTYWGKKLQVEQGFFIGTIPLLLALAILFRKKLVIGIWGLGFFKWLTIISFLLALGSWSPFRLLGLEPSLWFFSSPARWLLFTSFGLSVLAAYGWDYFPTLEFTRRIGGKGRWLALGVAGVVLVAVFLANLALFAVPQDTLITFAQTGITKLQSLSSPDFARPPEYYSDKIFSLLRSLRTSSVSLASPFTALPLILLLATPLLLKRPQGKQLILAAATAELIIIAASTNPAVSWQHILTPPETVAQLPPAVEQREARLYSLRDFEDTGAFLTNPTGRDFARVHEEPRTMLLPLIHTQFGLPGVAWPASLDLSEQARVLENLRAGLDAGNTQTAEDLNIGALIFPSPRVGEGQGEVEIQVLHPKSRASLLLADGSEIPADYREVSPSHIQITADSPEAATLIVRDTYFPGWEATVDGAATEITPAGPQGIFRSVLIPQGNHTVTMRYKPIILVTGIATSLAALALLLILSLPAHSRVHE